MGGDVQTSPLIEKAWASYQRDLSIVRKEIQGVWYYSRNPLVRAQAESYLQQAVGNAYTMSIMPRQNYPLFYTDTFLAPGTFSFIGPNPDTRYRITFLIGRKSYRIWGKRNTNPFCYLQLNRDYFVPESRMLGSYMLDDFKIEKDGSFEVILSPERHKGNWIQLDPTSGRPCAEIKASCFWGSP